jgi:hypothetical protein
MADLEEAENDDLEAARQWLLRAATAEPDPSWKCTSCGAAWLHWSPICGKCETLGTLDWGTPERARDALGTTIIAPDPVLTDQSAGGEGGGGVGDGNDGDNDSSGDGTPGDDAIEADQSFIPDAEETTPTRRLPMIFGGRRLTLL